MIVLTLPYPISANRYWRPVHVGNHVTIVPTKEAKQYRLDVANRALEQGLRQVLSGRIAVAVRLFPARPQDWATRVRKLGAGWDDGVRCIDLDNANKVLLDSLKGVAFEDDRWVRRLQSERMEPDGHGARVIVAIEQLRVEQPQGDLLAAA